MANARGFPTMKGWLKGKKGDDLEQNYSHLTNKNTLENYHSISLKTPAGGKIELQNYLQDSLFDLRGKTHLVCVNC